MLPTAAPATTVLDFSAPERLLRVGDDEVAYYRAGEGPDVVLVHGWPLHAATFRDLVPALAPHFTCHLIDLPGAGHTKSRTEGPLSLGDHRDTLLAVVEALGIERCAMIGHDSGAAITRMAAAALGDRVWGLVMGNTEIPGHHAWLVVAFGLVGKIGGPGLFARLLASRTFRRSYFCFGSCFGDPRVAEGAFLDRFVTPLIESRDRLRGQLRLLAGFDWRDVDGLEETHARIAAPVQMIWGEDDPYFPLEKARAMRFAGPSEMVVIPDTKLFAHEEAPEKFAAHALRFLREHGPR